MTISDLSLSRLSARLGAAATIALMPAAALAAKAKAAAATDAAAKHLAAASGGAAGNAAAPSVDPAAAAAAAATNGQPVEQGTGFPIGVPHAWEMGLQPAASPMKERMMDFHDHILLPVAVAIAVFVMLLLLWVMIRYNAKSNPTPSTTTHNTMLEIVWTIVPVILLVIIVIPSMRMLYYVDRTADAEMTLNITGYQWYWGYEYPDNGGINFMANLVPDKQIDASKGQHRLLSTDNAVVLPVDTNIRLMMTGADVIHSWAVPAFGVKLDTVPGRHNETWVRIDKEGTFYGQCSELCGQGHGFMPIEVHAVSKEAFANWVHAEGGKMPAELAAEKASKDAADAKAKADAAAKAKADADKAAADKAKAGAKADTKKDTDNKDAGNKDAGKKAAAKKGE